MCFNVKEARYFSAFLSRAGWKGLGICLGASDAFGVALSIELPLGLVSYTYNLLLLLLHNVHIEMRKTFQFNITLLYRNFPEHL